MDPDGSCVIAQENRKWEEIPTKKRSSGLFRYQSSCFSFSTYKWATGIRLSLLDLLITWVWNGPYHPDQHLGWHLRCAKGSSSTALLFVPRDPGWLLFTISIQKCSSRKAIPWEKQEKKWCWSSTSCLSGLWPLQGRGEPQQRAKVFGHWLTMKIITRMVVPGHFKYCS